MSVARLWSVGAHKRGQSRAGAPERLVEAEGVLARRLLAPDPPYPCHFGVQGQLNGQTWITGLDMDDPSWSVGSLADTLRAYRRIAWQGRKRQSLVVFVGPPRTPPDLGRDTTR